MTHLRGITWDHIRGIAPLVATSEAFSRLHPSITITWEKRSLKDFESYPIEILAQRYDLIMLDHPFMGTGIKERAIVPLQEYMPAEFLEDQKRNSVGPSYDTYTWEGQQWALAVDTAAQVSAFREDLVTGLEWAIPKTWDEVLEQAKSLPDSMKIGFPLNPTHAFLSLLSICGNIGTKCFWNDSSGIEPTIGEEALQLLKTVATMAHPASLRSNPIDILERMSDQDEIVYVPLIFGYSNYARTGFRRSLVHFTDIPSFRQDPSGSVIGGVGLAISAKCENKQAAASYAMYVASGECQSSLFFANGGQPGHRMAWTDKEVNRESHDFFHKTLSTLDHAFIRPRYIGYIDFQEQAGERVHSFLCNGGNSKEVIKSINQLYLSLRHSTNDRGRD